MPKAVSGPAGNIDEVIVALDAVTARARDERSTIGYFPALYAQVTRTVARGIDTGFFDDGPRMQRLVVTFANRYLTAREHIEQGTQPTRSWGVAFDAVHDATPIVLQHLLLGINAHINLDLGIAAAQVAPGEAITDLRRDFDRINHVLALMTSHAQHALAQISPWLGLLDVLGGRTDDDVIRFSIEVARNEAWRFAVELARTPIERHPATIQARDLSIAQLGQRVRHPGLLTTALWLIRLRESKDVPRNLDLLTSIPPADLKDVEGRMGSRKPR